MEIGSLLVLTSGVGTERPPLNFKGTVEWGAPKCPYCQRDLNLQSKMGSKPPVLSYSKPRAVSNLILVPGRPAYNYVIAKYKFVRVPCHGKVSQNAPESISERLKLKISWGACPQTPLATARFARITLCIVSPFPQSWIRPCVRM